MSIISSKSCFFLGPIFKFYYRQEEELILINGMVEPSQGISVRRWLGRFSLDTLTVANQTGIDVSRLVGGK